LGAPSYAIWGGFDAGDRAGYVAQFDAFGTAPSFATLYTGVAFAIAIRLGGPKQCEVILPKQVPAVEVGKQRLCYQWHATKVAFVGSNAESTPSPLFPEGSPQ